MKTMFASALLFAFLEGCLLVHANIGFTNLKCTSLDRPFADFEYCFLKSVNRSYKYLSLKVNLFHIPLTEVSVKAALLKRANGFKPFLYNLTIDGCTFLKSRKANKVFEFFFGAVEPYSNINHTCPYYHDIYVEKLPISHINNLFAKVLSFPDGEYMMDTVWLAYNIPRVRIQLKVVKS